MDDDEIKTLVKRLSRRHPSGGTVIERAAILAEGADSAAVLAWIAAHDGVPEELAALAGGRGLHSERVDASAAGDGRPPLRFVLPAGALG